MSERAVLLTVSGEIPRDLAARTSAGDRPRTDYQVLASYLGADVLDRPRSAARGGLVGRLLARIAGPDVAMAWACFRARHRYDVIFTDGEQIGMPLALLLLLTHRGPVHVMIVHTLSPAKKSTLFRLLRLGRRIDRLLVYATSQERFAVEELGVDPERVVLTTFMTDTSFFDPDATPASPAEAERPLLSSAGLEFRDYPTMIRAVDGMDVDVWLAAASPWSKREDNTRQVALPPNVQVGRMTLAELRELYARSAVVVVPVVETDFQAGITTILEAMAMGRPVVVSRTEGQTDAIIEGETGRYVPPGDPAALRAVVQELLDDPEAAEALGAAARRWVVEHADVEVYARRLAAVVAEARVARCG